MKKKTKKIISEEKVFCDGCGFDITPDDNGLGIMRVFMGDDMPELCSYCIRQLLIDFKKNPHNINLVFIWECNGCGKMQKERDVEGYQKCTQCLEKIRSGKTEAASGSSVLKIYDKI